tara:strand:- start:471 stop:731 length:261 start_codon:yes stop_codon:yes gene_type:complete
MNITRRKAFTYWTDWDKKPFTRDFVLFNLSLLTTILGEGDNVKKFAYSKEGTIIMLCFYIYVLSMVSSLGWNAGQGSKIDIDLNLK